MGFYIRKLEPGCLIIRNDPQLPTNYLLVVVFLQPLGRDFTFLSFPDQGNFSPRAARGDGKPKS